MRKQRKIELAETIERTLSILEPDAYEMMTIGYLKRLRDELREGWRELLDDKR